MLRVMLAHHTYLSAAAPCLLAPGSAPSLSATNYLGNQALVVLHTVPSTVVVAYQTLACCTRVHHFGLTSTLPAPELPRVVFGQRATNKELAGVEPTWRYCPWSDFVVSSALLRFSCFSYKQNAFHHIRLSWVGSLLCSNQVKG